MAACALPRPHLCDEVFLGALAMPLLCAEDDADAELEPHAGVLGAPPLAAFAGPLRAAFPGQPHGAKNTPHTPGPAEDRGVGGSGRSMVTWVTALRCERREGLHGRLRGSG